MIVLSFLKRQWPAVCLIIFLIAYCLFQYRADAFIIQPEKDVNVKCARSRVEGAEHFFPGK